MMREEKNLSLRRYVVCLGSILFVVFGLVFVLSSCDKEALPVDDSGAAPGPPVSISVTILGISADGEDITRSAAPAEPVTETVVLDDGMLMEMSLAPDPAAELRAAPTPLPMV
jgi:hypothetical protein